MICWLRSAGVRGLPMILLAREIAVMLVEQHLDLALRVASRGYVLDHGTVAFAESAQDVRTDPKLLQYLAS
jgi:branched-chain amino acid transport system ATP-binding protein